MSLNLLDTIKQTAIIIQKADNLSLYKQILDIQQLALAQQDEMQRLREENKELLERINLKQKVIRHKQPVITIKNDNTIYCATCYGKDNKLIQMLLIDDYYCCPVCRISYIHTPID